MIDHIDQLIEEDNYSVFEDFDQYTRNECGDKKKKIEDYLEMRKLKDMFKEDPFYN